MAAEIKHRVNCRRRGEDSLLGTTKRTVAIGMIIVRNALPSSTSRKAWAIGFDNCCWPCWHSQISSFVSCDCDEVELWLEKILSSVVVDDEEVELVGESLMK